jgi:LacI family gluconate utilization system Gnt-I transcriptional repressor
MADRTGTVGTPPKRITLADVARRAGTSTITASRALRRPDMVSDGLRARITEAVDALGYVPNPAARALASRRSATVSVLVPSITDEASTGVLKGLYDAEPETPLSLQLGLVGDTRTATERSIRMVLAQAPAGIIVANAELPAAACALLDTAGCPVVQIGDLAGTSLDMRVGFSHRDAGRKAAEHLLEQGYRAPAFLGTAIDARSDMRLAGYREAMEAAGRAAHVITAARASDAAPGTRLFERLRRDVPEADAVLCSDDTLALSVQFAARRAGLAVGRDFGICGFGDQPLMAAAWPAITGLRLPRHEIGRAALAMIAARLDGQDTGPTARDLGFALIPRASTARG